MIGIDEQYVLVKVYGYNSFAVLDIQCNPKNKDVKKEDFLSLTWSDGICDTPNNVIVGYLQ